MLICLGFIGLQYTIGFMEGRGAASLADRFFISYNQIYTEEACNVTLSASEAIIRTVFLTYQFQDYLMPQLLP
jgi:hypothetical protein